MQETLQIYVLILPLLQGFGEREQGVVVIYVTTLAILRDTWARCVKVRKILRNLLIKVDERDVFMSRENQVELMDRMAMVEVNLPQVFVNGQYLGVRSNSLRICVKIEKLLGFLEIPSTKIQRVI